jgi:hypothetical protein
VFKAHRRQSSSFASSEIRSKIEDVALIGLQLIASPITDSHAWIVRTYSDRLACVKAADEINGDKMRKYHCQEVSSPQK